MSKRNTKPRIAILGTRGYPVVYSGYETWVKEICTFLNQRYELHVYCHRGLFKQRPKVLNNVHLHYLPTIESKFLSQIIFSALSTIHALFMHYDIYLYVNAANGPFGWVLRNFGKRTAINTDGIEWERPKWKGLGAKYFKWSAKVSTKNFDVVISDADGIRNYYLDKFKTDSVVIAYGAYLQQSEGTTAIEKFGLKKNDYYLIVGRLIPDNHVEEIILGFKKCSTQKKLVVVGDVTYNDAFAQRMKTMASENIIFTGYITDQVLLKELFANCYSYMHGHAYGGTNPSLLKALAYGCCILAHDNIFTREVLDNDKYGFYFKSSPDSIAELLNYIDGAPDEAEQKRKISRQRITEKYTWDKISDQYDKLFQRMLNEPEWKVNVKTFHSPK